MINVKNTNNQPVKEAYVYIENNGYLVNTGQTDAYGNFYTEIIGGMVTFRATSTGYKDTVMTQVIDSDSIVVLVMEEPLNFFTLLFSVVMLSIVIYATVAYIWKDKKIKKSG